METDGQYPWASVPPLHITFWTFWSMYLPTIQSASPPLLSWFPCLEFSSCLFLTHVALICLPQPYGFTGKQKDAFKDVTLAHLAGSF